MHSSNPSKQTRPLTRTMPFPKNMERRALIYDGLSVTKSLDAIELIMADFREQLRDLESLKLALHRQLDIPDYILRINEEEIVFVAPDNKAKNFSEIIVPQTEETRIYKSSETTNVVYTPGAKAPVYQRSYPVVDNKPPPVVLPKVPDHIVPVVKTTTHSSISTTPAALPPLSQSAIIGPNDIPPFVPYVPPSPQGFELTLHPGSVEVTPYDGTEDWVSALHTYAQKKRFGAPRFQLKQTSGPPHQPTFTVELNWRMMWFYVTQTGSRKDAERSLARHVMIYCENACEDCQGSGLPTMKSQSLDEDHYTEQIRRSKAVKYRKQKLAFDRSVHDEPIRKKKKTFETEVTSFHTYLIDHGYTTDNLQYVPTHLVKHAFDLYISGYGLMNCAKIRRLNATEQRLFQRDLTKLPCPDITPQVGVKTRRAILRGYRDLYPHDNGVISEIMKSQGLRDFIMDKINHFRAQRAKNTWLNQINPVQPPTPTAPGVAHTLGKQASQGFMEGVKEEIGRIFATIKEGLALKAGVIGAFFQIVCYIILVIVILGVFGAGWFLAMRAVIRGFVFLSSAVIGHVFDADPLDDKIARSQVLDEEVRETILQLLWRKASGFPDDVENFISRAELTASRSYGALAKFSVSFNSINVFLTTISLYCMKAIDFVAQLITGLPFFENSRAAHLIHQKWKTLVDLTTGKDASKLKTDRDFCLKVIKSFDELEAATKLPGYSKITETKQAAITNLRFRVLDDVRTAYVTLSNKHGRQEPVWVYVEGPPKQGKSLFMKSLIMGVRRKLGLPKIDMTQVYPRSTTDKFWSNYSGQWVTMIDDLFQSKDTEIRGREAYDMIRLVNTVPYPVDMPDVGSKGITFFTSPLIMTTTNVINDNVVNLGLHDTKALWRRRTLHVSLRLKTTASNINISALNKDQFQNDYDVEILTPGANPGMFVRELVTPIELINRIAKEYTIRQINFEKGEPMTAISDEDWDAFFPKPPSSPLLSSSSSTSSSDDDMDNDNDNDSDNKPTPEVSQEQEMRDLKRRNRKRVKKLKKDIRRLEEAHERREEVREYEGSLFPRHDPYVNEAAGTGLLSDEDVMESQVLDHPFAIMRHDPSQPCQNPSLCQHRGVLSPSWNLFVSAILDRPVCYYDGRHRFWERVNAMDNRSKSLVYHAYYNYFDKDFRFIVRQVPVQSGINVHHIPVVKAVMLLPGQPTITRFFETDHWISQNWRMFNDDRTMAMMDISYPIWPDDVCRTVPLTARRNYSQILFGTQQFCISNEEFQAAHPGDDIVQFMNELMPDQNAMAHPSIWTRTKDFRTDVWDMIVSNFLFYACVFGVVALSALSLCVTGFLLSMGFKLAKKWTMTSQSFDKTAAKKQAKIIKRIVRKPKNMTSQVIDDGADKLSAKILGSHQRWTKFIGKNGKSSYAWLTFVEGSVAATANHVMVMNEGCEKVHIFYNPGDTEEYKELIVGEVLRFEDRDLAYVRFTNCQPFPSLRKHIMKEKITDKVTGAARVSVSDGMRSIHHSTYMEPRTRQTDRAGSVSGYYAVDQPGEDGECGALNILYNTKYDTKIIGLHVAADSHGSLIAPMFQGEWDPLFKIVELEPVHEVMKNNCCMTEIYVPPEIDVQFDESQRLHRYHQGMTTIAKVNPMFSFPGKTQLHKSPIATGVTISTEKGPVHMAPPYPLTTAPAKLRKGLDENGIEQDPVSLSLRKFKGKKVLKMPPEFYDDDVWDGCFPTYLTNRGLRMLTIEEAVFGCKALNIDGIDISTSSAFPYVAAGIKRSELINKETKFIHPMLRASVQYRLDMAAQGKIVPLVCIGILKDETRELSRVHKYFTRMFLNGPIDHLIFSRMALGAYAIAVEHTRLADIQVGLNPYSSDWRILYERMTRFGKDMENIFDNDTAGWDINFCPEVSYGFTEQFEKRITKDPFWLACIFSCLASAFSPIVIVLDNVMMVDMQPSGWFGTSLMNSVLNSVKNRVIFKKLSQKHTSQPLKFEDFVELLVYGDDVNGAFDPDIKSWFNGQTIAQAAKKYFNHEHTDPNKGDDIPLGRNIDSVVFLQRKYTFSEGLISAPLSEQTLYSMVQWIRESKEFRPEVQFKINCDNALIEWAIHGKKFFEKNKIILNVFLRAVNQPQFSKMYEDVMAELVHRHCHN
jgi:hypothetical protein